MTAPETLIERSRRIAADPAFVVFGGGNTSEKGESTDRLGHKKAYFG